MEKYLAFAVCNSSLYHKSNTSALCSVLALVQTSFLPAHLYENIRV